jgi:type I restriction enzyme S subunit
MSWELVRMQDIFDISRGGSPRPINDYLTDQENGVNWIMIGDTKGGGKYISKTAKKIKPEGVKKSRFVKEGDFLLTNSMSFGRPYILKTSGCIHDGWLVLSPVNENIHTDYFYYYLGSKEIKIILASKAAGAVVKNLNKDIVKNLKIPLPPLDQQKKIAAILDAADAYRQKTKALITKYEELTQSLFLDMFGDSDRFEQKLISDIASDKKYSLSSGPFGSNLTSKHYTDTGVVILRGTNVTSGVLDLTKVKYVSESKAKELKRSELTPGDVVVVAVGSSGKALRIPDNLERAIMSQNFNKITPNTNIVSALYLQFCFNSQLVQNQFKKEMTDTVRTFLSLTKIKRVTIPVPPIELQNQFAERVQAIQVQKTQAQASLVQAEDLFNSLLQRAFKGELS